MQEFGLKIGYQGLITASLRIVERFKTIILLGLITAVLINCFSMITTYDFPWQLAEGEFILNHGYPGHSVLKAYGEISPHFANEYVPYEAVVAWVNHLAGWLGLCLFFALLGLFIYGPCLLAFIRSRGRFSLMAVFGFIFALWIIDKRLISRPELVADICYIAEATMLLHWNSRSWSGFRTAAFGLVFFIWTNTHDSFLLGLVMLGIWYGQILLCNWKSFFSIKEMAWIRPGAVALLGCVLNPCGLGRFYQPFQLHSLLWGQGISFEMWPATLDEAQLSLICAGFALLFLVMRIRVQKSYWLVATLLLLEYLTITSNRYSVFVGLTLLVALSDVLNNASNNVQARIYSLWGALGQLILYSLPAICIITLVTCLIYSKLEILKNRARFFYPGSLVLTNSSFTWLDEHRSQNYILLSHYDAGSWSEMPNTRGIHPLFDSGTHRYGDQVCQLYYYALFSPDAFRLVLSRLNINAIILTDMNISWASILNANPEWRLTQVDTDSQLYLRKSVPGQETGRELFLRWEKNRRKDDPDFVNASYKDLVRGLRLRPDEESLRMLESSSNLSWMVDSRVTYLQDWLGDLPDDSMSEALKNLDNKMDSRSAGLRILFALRLKQYRQADEIAEQWNPSFWDDEYQGMQELRARAFLSNGDDQAARKILQSLLPQPRYSLRWAQLCQQAYANVPEDMPQNARLLTSLAGNFEWLKPIISSLNENISRWPAQPAISR